MSETKTRPMLPVPTMTAEEQKDVAKQVAKLAGGSNVARFFEANKASLAKMLPEHMTPDRFMRTAMNALRTTPKLMECSVESLFGATMFCAQVGLEPNTPQGHIYLIPFKNNRKERFEVQVIIGYQGLIALARRTGEIESIMAQAVYEKDLFVFDYLRSDELSHKPPKSGDRGAFIGAWAMARFKDGGQAFDYMPKADIDKIRDGSQGYRTAKKFNKTDTPWIAHYDQMARKTAVRRLSKYLPMSIQMAAAAALDERADRRASQGLHRMLDSDTFDLSVMAMGEEEDEAADETPPPPLGDPQQAQADPEPPPEDEAVHQPRRARQTKPKDQPPAEKPTPEPEPEKPAATETASPAAPAAEPAKSAASLLNFGDA